MVFPTLNQRALPPVRHEESSLPPSQRCGVTLYRFHLINGVCLTENLMVCPTLHHAIGYPVRSAEWRSICPVKMSSMGLPLRTLRDAFLVPWSARRPFV